MAPNSKAMQHHVRAELQTELKMVSRKPPATPSTQLARRHPHLRQTTNFAMSIRDPFSPSAVGVHVPDMYSMPTATFHARGACQLTSAATGTLGAVFLPNVVVSAIDTLQDTSNYVCMSANSGALTPIPGTNNTIYGAASIATLANILTSYRVVSWGIKITNLMPPLTCAGKLYVAVIPALQTVPSYGNTTLMGNSGNSYAQQCFLNMNACSSRIIDLPICRELTMSELAGGAIELCPGAIDPSFYNFKNVQNIDQINSTQYIGDQVVTTGGTSTVSASVSGESSMAGGCCILIFGEGFITNTPILEVEYVYHLEGTPLVSVSGLAAGAAIATPGSTNAVEAALALNPPAQSIQYKTPGQQLASQVGGVVRAIGEFADSNLGKAMGTALLALL